MVASVATGKSRHAGTGGGTAAADGRPVRISAFYHL